MPQQQLNPNLMSYLKEHGEVCQSLENADASQSEASEKFRDKLMESLTAEPVKPAEPSFAYGSDTLIPGKPISIDNLRSTPNQDIAKVAEETLVTRAAAAKLERERQREKKRPMEERVKDMFIQSVINQQKTAYFESNGCCMSGKQLRYVTREIKRRYATGKMRPSKEEYDKIVDFLNSPLSDPNPAQHKPMTSGNNRQLQIGNLISSI